MWGAGDYWKPNASGNHFHGPAVHEIMHSASFFRLWITPIVAWPVETTHPAPHWVSITVHSWSEWHRLVYSRCCKSNYVSRGRYLQNASLRIFMVPAYGGEYSWNPLDETFCIACNGSPRLRSMQHLLFPRYASGRAIVYLTNAIV